MSDEEELLSAFKELSIENKKLTLSNVLFAASIEKELRLKYGLDKKKAPPKDAA
jgi:hypothetical protein